MADQRDPKQNKDAKNPQQADEGRELSDKELEKASGGATPISDRKSKLPAEPISG